MPDLGKYTDTVLGAYAVALILIAVLTVQSLLKAAKVKRTLSQTEKRRQKNGKQRG